MADLPGCCWIRPKSRVDSVDGRITADDSRLRVTTRPGAVYETEISLSAIVDFPRKSFALSQFTDRATCLWLALKALLWRLRGTIVGTVARPNPSAYAFDKDWRQA